MEDLVADPREDGVGAASDGDDDHGDHGDFQGGGVGEGEDPAAIDDGEDAFDGEAEEAAGGYVGQDLFEWDAECACGCDEKCEWKWRRHEAAESERPACVFLHLRFDVFPRAAAFVFYLLAAFF